MSARRGGLVVGCSCVAIGAGLLWASYAAHAFILAVAGLTIGGMGLLVLSVKRGPEGGTVWYCSPCMYVIDEPAWSQNDPADRSPYCPICGNVADPRAANLYVDVNPGPIWAVLLCLLAWLAVYQAWAWWSA